MDGWMCLGFFVVGGSVDFELSEGVRVMVGKDIIL